MAKRKYKQLPLPTLERIRKMPSKPKDPTMQHWAVAAYRTAMRLTPTPAARAKLIARIEELGLTEPAWKNALDVWLLNDYAKSNIAGMLEYANEHPGGADGPTVRVPILRQAQEPAVKPPPLHVAPQDLGTKLEWEQTTLPLNPDEEWAVRRWNESQEGLF